MGFGAVLLGLTLGVGLAAVYFLVRLLYTSEEDSISGFLAHRYHPDSYFFKFIATILGTIVATFTIFAALHRSIDGKENLNTGIWFAFLSPVFSLFIFVFPLVVHRPACILGYKPWNNPFPRTLAVVQRSQARPFSYTYDHIAKTEPQIVLDVVPYNRCRIFAMTDHEHATEWFQAQFCTDLSQQHWLPIRRSQMSQARGQDSYGRPIYVGEDGALLLQASNVRASDLVVYRKENAPLLQYEFRMPDPEEPEGPIEENQALLTPTLAVHFCYEIRLLPSLDEFWSKVLHYLAIILGVICGWISLVLYYLSKSEFASFGILPLILLIFSVFFIGAFFRWKVAPVGQRSRSAKVRTLLEALGLLCLFTASLYLSFDAGDLLVGVQRLIV
jgi:hypothetical protein